MNELFKYIKDSLSFIEVQGKNMRAEKGDILNIRWSREKGIYVESIEIINKENP